jgi:hypothetical protein
MSDGVGLEHITAHRSLAGLSPTGWENNRSLLDRQPSFNAKIEGYELFGLAFSIWKTGH